MDRNDAYRELGYGRPTSSRPIIDPGAFDYVEKFGRRMTRVQGLKTARSILRRQEISARGIQAHGQDSAGQEARGKRQEAGL